MHGEWLAPRTVTAPGQDCRAPHLPGPSRCFTRTPRSLASSSHTLKIPWAPPLPRPFVLQLLMRRNPIGLSRRNRGIKMQSGVQTGALGVPTKAQGTISPMITAIGHWVLTMCQRLCECYINKTFLSPFYR